MLTFGDKSGMLPGNSRHLWPSLPPKAKIFQSKFEPEPFKKAGIDIPLLSRRASEA